ncbi:MAG: hypothetical protein RL748_3895, partial [Pseudomonadota bacterium]
MTIRDHSPFSRRYRAAALLRRAGLWWLCWHVACGWAFAPQDFTFADPYFEAIES